MARRMTPRQRAALRKATLASARARRKQKYGPRRGKRTAAQNYQRRKRSIKRTQRAAAAVVVAGHVAPALYGHHLATADLRRNSTRGRNKAARRSMSRAQKRSSRSRAKDQAYLNKHVKVTTLRTTPYDTTGRRIRAISR